MTTTRPMPSCMAEINLAVTLLYGSAARATGSERREMLDGVAMLICTNDELQPLFYSFVRRSSLWQRRCMLLHPRWRLLKRHRVSAKQLYRWDLVDHQYCMLYCDITVHYSPAGNEDSGKGTCRDAVDRGSHDSTTLNGTTDSRHWRDMDCQ